MRIWLVTIGEPLPVTENVRLYRAGILAGVLAERGHHVTWWTSSFNHFRKEHECEVDCRREIRTGNQTGYILEVIRSRGYQANVSPGRIVDHIGLARKMGRRFRTAERPDIILCSFPPISLANETCRYGRRYDVPVVVDIRDLWPDIFVRVLPAIVRPLGRTVMQPVYLAMRRNLRTAVAITGITEGFAEWGHQRAGTPAGQKVASFPLAYSSREPPEAEKKQAGHFWDGQGIEESGLFTLCFFGSLNKQFDLNTVISAANILASEIPELRLVICGLGEYLEKYRRQASGNPAVIFPGWVNGVQIWALMRRSSLGLAPYYSNPDFELSIPNKAVEYMSAGLPVLTSLQGVLGDLLLSNRCGLVYNDGDVPALCSLIKQVHADAWSREEMSQAVSDLYERQFVAENVYARMAAFIEEIQSRGQGAMKETE